MIDAFWLGSSRKAPCVNQCELHVTRLHDMMCSTTICLVTVAMVSNLNQCRHLRSEKLSPAVEADGDLANRIASLEHGDAFRSLCERQDEGGPGAQRA
jgi:hypothetical protein